MVGELRSLAMISGGMVLGTMGGKAIDRMLKVDSALPGLQAQKFARPAVLLGAGVLGSLKLKNQDLKMLSAGVGATGVLSTMQVVLKKDFLSGMDGLGSNYSAPVARAMEAYEPHLPALSSGAPALASLAEASESYSSVPETEFEMI